MAPYSYKKERPPATPKEELEQQIFRAIRVLKGSSVKMSDQTIAERAKSYVSASFNDVLAAVREISDDVMATKGYHRGGKPQQTGLSTRPTRPGRWSNSI